MERIFNGIAGMESADGQSIYDVWKDREKLICDTFGLDHYWNASTAQHAEIMLGKYAEITNEVYWYFLEILPPIQFRNGHFAMIERQRDNITSAFFEIAGRFFWSYVDLDKIGAMAEIKAAIVKAEF